MALEDVTALAARYLRWADRLLPHRVVGFYLLGSAALDAFRPGRSDLDFVAVVDGPFTAAERGRARALHLATAAGSARRALVRGQLALPGTCNGAFVDAADLQRPVSQITPLASHTGGTFTTGKAFDVNPVMWKVFAERGIRIRGRAPSELGLDPEPDVLRAWTRHNLEDYWKRWAETTAVRPHPSYRLRPRWMTAWGVLGAPRLHRTITTGEVISKEAAGEYARATFDVRWHPIVDDALAYWRRRPAPRRFTWAERLRETTAFTHHVATSIGA